VLARQTGERPEVLFARQAVELDVVRVELEPVADGSASRWPSAGRDHRVALGHGVGHGLLADHVLAGRGRLMTCSACRPFGVTT
jgi:hypothetical protein